jgi:hypothetical protein
MIKAPASLLRFYGITEKCRICEARDSKKIDSELDLKPLLSVILNLAIVLEKGMSREEMRSLSIGYEIPFSLRTNKPYFARALAKYWLRSMDYKSILKYVEVCRVHYQQLIDKDDRHFPDFNIEMVERCVRAVRHINKIKKMNKENQNG